MGIVDNNGDEVRHVDNDVNKRRTSKGENKENKQGLVVGEMLYEVVGAQQEVEK